MKPQNQTGKAADENRQEMFKQIEQASVTLDWIMADDETACPSHIGELLDEASAKITVNLKKVEAEHAALMAVAEAGLPLLDNVTTPEEYQAFRNALANLAAARGESEGGK